MEAKAFILLTMLVCQLLFQGAECSCNRAELLDRSVPCVEGGKLMAKPNKACCAAMKNISPECCCTLMISAMGKKAARMLKTYKKICKLAPLYKC